MTTGPGPPRPGADQPPLPDLILIERADVYKGDDLAAHLTRTPAGTYFEYTAEWVAARGDAVASTLPVTSNAVITPGSAVPAFFAGLLPEGRRLTALRQRVKTSADDELSLLLAIGGDTIGDVRVVVAGCPPVDVPPMLTSATFDDVRFGDLLAAAGLRPDRVGIPGVQDKVSATMINLPVATATDRFILKLDPPEFAHLVANEAFFLNAARSSGLAVADWRVLRDRDGRSGLLVRRFDRVQVGRQTRSLAVEDGCQVLGRPPGDKYRIDSASLVAGLSQLCGAPVVAAKMFLTQLAFAYLSANGDAHAKNFAVLRGPDGEWWPSPAYDLPSSQPYGDTTLALPIGGRRDADVPGSAFVELGLQLGVPARATRAALNDLSERADGWLARLDDLPFGAGPVRKLRRVVEYRRRSLGR